MEKRCVAFSTEYRSEYLKKKHTLVQPIKPILDCEIKERVESKNVENAEKILRDFLLDRYHTSYQIQFKEPDLGEGEELDLGNELIVYLKDLYFNPHTEKVPRMQYTAARIFGYANPKRLHGQLCSYQDTIGRTGGQVILQNVNRMMAAKRRALILQKLQAAAED